MNDSPLGPEDDRPDLQSELIDRVCDRFEAAVREGRHPRIEDFLDSFPDLNRHALLQELISLELDLHRRTNETVSFDAQSPQHSFASYYQRFPDASEMLQELQRDWELRMAKQSDSDASAISFDPEVETLDHVASKTPRLIKQFELQTILGQGGFGIVWRAKDKRLQRDVAIKVPRSDRLAHADRSMFLREARAAAKLKHPNIIAIHEVGEDDSEVFIVSELIDGVSLKVWLESHKLTANAAAQLIAKLAKAVQHAHDKKIVHRDLKPANVLMDQHGEPHVADFGLAKRDTGEESLSIQGKLMGTPAYMAPEQARGDHSAIDPRTDVYALGAIFYELLTGVRPFRGEIGILLEQVKNAPPEAPRAIKPEIPRDLEAICLKCLAKDRAKRYASAAALAEDIHLYLAGETLRGIPAALPNRIWKWFNRKRHYVIAIGLTFFLAATVAGGVAWQFRGTKPIPVDLRQVNFVTEPEDCEITVVAVNPQTGEPDPARIQHAKGRTPLTMTLEPADYLVVAVLDETRFHEVHRHVPPLSETVPTSGNASSWILEPSGHIGLPKVRIPRSDVTHSMGLVEKSNRLAEPQAANSAAVRAWRISSFYVDTREITVEDIELWGIRDHGAANWEKEKRAVAQPGLGPGPFSTVRFGLALNIVEAEGKRLPSAAELYYLAEHLEKRESSTVNEKDGTDILVLPDRSRIAGLHSGVWEWTSTKPVGPFTGLPLGIHKKAADLHFKVVGCGELNDNLKVPLTSSTSKTGFRTALEHSSAIGIRGVRSSKPRRKPIDFSMPIEDVPAR